MECNLYKYLKSYTDLSLLFICSLGLCYKSTLNTDNSGDIKNNTNNNTLSYFALIENFVQCLVYFIKAKLCGLCTIQVLISPIIKVHDNH